MNSVKKSDTFNFNDIFMPEVNDDTGKDKNIVDVALKTKIEKNQGAKFKKLPYKRKLFYFKSSYSQRNPTITY